MYCVMTFAQDELIEPLSILNSFVYLTPARALQSTYPMCALHLASALLCNGCGYNGQLKIHYL